MAVPGYFAMEKTSNLHPDQVRGVATLRVPPPLPLLAPVNRVRRGSGWAGAQLCVRWHAGGGLGVLPACLPASARCGHWRALRRPHTLLAELACSQWSGAALQVTLIRLCRVYIRALLLRQKEKTFARAQAQLPGMCAWGDWGAD